MAIGATSPGGTSTSVADAHADFAAISPEQALCAVRALPRGAFATLYARAAPATWEHFTPGRYAGTNSLPLFRTFEKPLARVGDALYGHNVQPWAALTGPGYFAVTDAEGVVFDYSRVPDVAPPGWPAPRSNDAGLARAVFGGLVDKMRSLAKGVTIGEVWRHGRCQRQYFILVCLHRHD
jgi:hypothetical protein